LARASALADPPWSSYALSPLQWKAAMRASIETLPEQLPGACAWQLWHYDPALAANSDIVDPLSLTLSLQDEVDERVQKALEELRGTFPW
jgi:hypothetical protein